MARPLRLAFAGALYHVTSRGDRREDIYESDIDREVFLTLLGHVCKQFNWVCYAYCLMSNHYHLLIETPDANLSAGMRQLNGVYTQQFNRINGKVGHVFQGRFKAILVDKESYLLELSRYIVLNPVRAQMVRSAGEWPWSSYRATIGKIQTYEWLNIQWLLARFSHNQSKAYQRYSQFVAQGKGQPSPWQELKNQVYLGDDQFVESMMELIDRDKNLSEVPSSQRRPQPQTIEYYEKNSLTRDEAIFKAYSSGGYTLKGIGDYFCIHYPTVSGIIKSQKSKT